MVNYALTNASVPGTLKSAQTTFLDRYTRTLDQRWRRYRDEHQHFYGTETRWADAPFWRRRQPVTPGIQKEAAKEAL